MIVIFIRFFTFLEEQIIGNQSHNIVLLLFIYYYSFY